MQWSGKRLPYVDNLVRLLVAEDLGKFPMNKVMRVVAPLGAAYIKQGGQCTKTVQPWPEGVLSLTDGGINRRVETTEHDSARLEAT